MGNTHYIWDLATGKLRSNFSVSGHNEVTFSPDGLYALTTNDENTVQVWDLMTGSPRTILDEDSFIEFSGFAPDGHSVIIASRNTLQIIPDDVYAPIDTVMKSLAGRIYRTSLTQEERDKYIRAAGRDRYQR